ncbi:MAG: response regulator [Gemmatimonadales bacterium]
MTVAPSPVRLLVIDDEPAIRRTLERGLSRHGYQIVAAPDGEAAYALLKSERVDAVLLDYQMPGMSGMAVYHAIAHRWPDLQGRILVMTGDPDNEDLRLWADHQGCAVIPKPFEMESVIRWLEEVLRQRRRRSGGEAGGSGGH